MDPTQTSSKAPGQPPSTPATPASSPEGPREGQLKRLRTWLISRTPANGTGTSPQAWKLAVNPQGEVVAASPLEGNGGDLRSTLGLPQEEVPTNPSGDTLLVRGVLTPSGYWELSPWHGW
ncbi:MAG: hypothetical protein ACKOOH_04580 [Cyanobium sp.]